MSKKSAPIPRPTPCWFFRDRNGRRYGPYTDAKEIRAILSNHCVGKDFQPAQEGYWKLDHYGEATELVMEDAEYNPVCPGDWLDTEKEKRHKALSAAYEKCRGHHVYRVGPVAGIHKSSRWKGMWRTPNFGRKVRDTGHGCMEDGEPPIRVKLRVSDYAWDDFPPNRVRKTWKCYRDHQWR